MYGCTLRFWGCESPFSLEDLLKRQGQGITLLRGLIEEGNKLAKRAADVLEEASIARKSARITVSSRHVGGIDALADQYAKLRALLDDACRGLCSLTPTSTPAAKLQQDMAIWKYSYYNKMTEIRPNLFEDSDISSLKDGMLHRSDDPTLSAKFLQHFLTQRYGPTKTKSFDFLSGSFGKQTYFTTVTWQDGQNEELVIRKMDAVPIMLHRQFLLDREFDLVTLVHKTGYICPQPLDLGWDVPGVDGNFYTIKSIPGKIPVSILEGKKEAISELLVLFTGCIVPSFSLNCTTRPWSRSGTMWRGSLGLALRMTRPSSDCTGFLPAGMSTEPRSSTCRRPSRPLHSAGCGATYPATHGGQSWFMGTLASTTCSLWATVSPPCWTGSGPTLEPLSRI